MNIIHTFGDSHASGVHSHWGYIKLDNVDIKCHHIGGRLMYTFGRLGTNLLNIRNFGVQEEETVIFCFGEIDCRNHIHKHVTESKQYNEVIDEVVEKYFKAIYENVSQYKKLKVCIYNVVPPHRFFDVGDNHPYPFLGSDNDRQLYTLYMNKRIKQLCEQYGYIYFDIYDNSCDEDGFLKAEYSDGSVHLRNTEHSISLMKDLLV